MGDVPSKPQANDGRGRSGALGAFPRDHSERVLDHAIPGVEGVYDRYAYEEEKATALEALAKLIDRIIHPPDATNVVPFPNGAGVEGVGD